jgi:2-keto-4-pentenoate hydratase
MDADPTVGDREDAIAASLADAWASRVPVAPVAGDLPDVAAAYRVQSGFVARLVARGDAVVGRKIGLTSRAIQEQLGIDQPDFGRLLASREAAVVNGRALVRTCELIAPRVEGEIAFRIARPLSATGSVVSAADVIAACDAAAPAFEVIDSRIDDWKITLLDTIADNASFGAFALGAWSADLLHADLAAVEMMVARGDEKLVRARGDAVLGHPANAVAWLATTLGALGDGLVPGDVVLSGALGTAAPCARGDLFLLMLTGCEPLVLEFA